LGSIVGTRQSLLLLRECGAWVPDDNAPNDSLPHIPTDSPPNAVQHTFSNTTTNTTTHTSTDTTTHTTTHTAANPTNDPATPDTTCRPSGPLQLRYRSRELLGWRQESVVLSGSSQRL